jgi:hypothetical protein
MLRLGTILLFSEVSNTSTDDGLAATFSLHTSGMHGLSPRTKMQSRLGPRSSNTGRRVPALRPETWPAVWRIWPMEMSCSTATAVTPAATLQPHSTAHQSVCFMTHSLAHFLQTYSSMVWIFSPLWTSILLVIATCVEPLIGNSSTLYQHLNPQPSSLSIQKPFRRFRQISLSSCPVIYACEHGDFNPRSGL